MTCKHCKQTFSPSKVATVTDYEGSTPEQLDIQIRCPGCDNQFYTFIATDDLTSEKD